MRQETHDGTRPGKQNASEPNPARSHKTSMSMDTYYKNEGKKLEMIRPNKGTREQRKAMHIFVRTNEGRLRQW